MEYKVLDSLHRPFHRPIWIVKWVCYFISLRQKSRRKYINCKEQTTDFYFTLLEWLHTNYPQDSDGVPSKESIEEVWYYFSQIENREKEERLRKVLSSERERGVETKIYSTYKAASYYMNLADDKLHFVGNSAALPNWNPNQLTKTALKSNISTTDRKMYVQHILQNDGHFFLAMCLLQKPVMKYELKMDVEIFKFMQRYYPVANFDYTKQSHSNYYVVRKRWVELLQAVNERGTLGKVLLNCIKENSEFLAIFIDIETHVKEYTTDLRKRRKFIEQKSTFVTTYQNSVKTNKDKSGFVNLYDISKEMRMSYDRFQSFLTQFYQEEKLVRNIFFINIVSTIEQRRRFYIGNAPVIKIKMTKNYGV